MIKKILVAEDDRQIATLIYLELKANNYEVVVTHDAFATLASAHRERPDLIILDMEIPEHIGFWCLSKLRNSRQTALIPIIFISSYADKQMRQKSLELGAEDFVTKPFVVHDLLPKVKKLLDKYKRS